MVVLDIKNLTVVYHTDQGIVEALDGVNFSIREGETVGVVGESGCGKSTMGKTILGVLPESSGEVVSGSIHFQGKNLLELSEEEINDGVRGRAITLIPQDPFVSFNPVFTIGTQILDIVKYKLIENFESGGQKGFLRRCLHPFSGEMKSRVIQMLKRVQIPSSDQAFYKYPHEMSGGQRQRVMIAMALAPQPSLIIADEPTTALDATIGAQVLELLKDLTKQFQTSVLFITHDLGVAYKICDRITVMYAGQIMESAPTDSFFKKRCHPYTRGLLDSLPNPKGEIQTIQGEIPSLINPPRGCRFHPRCPRALDNCHQQRPESAEIFPDHFVHCFNPYR
jgi:peptide/nickel transport system ATP-binding protein